MWVFEWDDVKLVVDTVALKGESMNLAAPMGISSVDWTESSLVAQMNRPLTRYKCPLLSNTFLLPHNEGVVIHMLTEKKYPLKKEILVQMLNLRLESEEESTMALELIRFIKKNKELSIPEQTATGKGTSNPLMAAEKARLLLKKDREYKVKKS
ncbi:hypothetical protein Tco_0906478 [Tanacetum coccineum]|uniref:Uncharacterized protein n=1 Tax=Tanacetum coccineum TaxID=301880 RepID=A0ABQ5CJT5_9ASTR